MLQCAADTWAAPGNLAPFHCWVGGGRRQAEQLGKSQLLKERTWQTDLKWREVGGCCRNKLALGSQKELSMEVDAKCLHHVLCPHTLTWVKDTLARSPMQRGLPQTRLGHQCSDSGSGSQLGFSSLLAGSLKPGQCLDPQAFNDAPRIHSVRVSRSLRSSRIGRGS